MNDLPRHWGTTPAERARPTRADGIVGDPDARWTRGVTSRASTSALWRWVCQLTVAPYSYDLVDNLGRRSPRTLTPGADDLAVGQRLLVLFVIDSFVPGEHLTMRLARPGRGLLREFAMTYAVTPDDDRRGSRLVVTVVVDGGGRSGGRSRRVVGTLVRSALAWGDLVMMRRQLRTLARLAERVGTD